MAAKDGKHALPQMAMSAAIGAEFGRVVSECVRMAAHAAERETGPRAVHAARRALKRARAVLRLGEVLGVRGAEQARRRLAGRARELSPLRDATVVAKKARCIEASLDRRTRADLRALVADRPTKTTAWWRRWKRALEAEAGAVERLDWGVPSLQAIAAALHESSARVCRREGRAEKSRKIGRLHAWRKALIVLREQVAVLRPWRGAEAARVQRKLDKLASRLGRALDYQVFVEAARRSGTKRKVKTLGKRRRKRAVKQAFKRWPKVRRAIARQP